MDIKKKMIITIPKNNPSQAAQTQQPGASKRPGRSTAFTLFILALLAGILLSACSGSSLTPSSWPGLATNGDALFVALSSHVYAVDAKGNEMWRYPAEADRSKTFYADPAVTSDGQVIVGDYSKNLYSIDSSANGAELWVFDQAEKNYIGSALVTDDAIYAPNTDNNLYVLNRQGQLQWTFATNHSLWAEPVLGENTLYLPAMDHNLYAIDLETHEAKWSLDMGGAMVAPFALDENGILYGGTLAKELIAVNTNDQSIVWRFPTNGSVWATPAIQDGVLYFGDSGGTIYAVNASDGSQKWSLDAGSPVIASVALYADGFIVGTEDGKIHQVNFDGSKKTWARQLEGKLYTTPVILNDNIIIFAVTDSKTELLIAFDMSGNEIWTYLPEK